MRTTGYYPILYLAILALVIVVILWILGVVS